MKFIGHRGASGEAPENTIEAITLAFSQGADGVEIDVQLTRDGRLILMHDDTALRTGNVDKNIREMTWKELQTLDVGSWMGPQWNQARVPLLDDILAITPDRAELFIEIKGNDKQIVPPLLDLLNAHRKNVVILSFDHDILKAIAPKYVTFMLTAYKLIPGNWPYVRKVSDLEAMIKKAKENRMDGIDMEYSKFTTQEVVEKVKRAGLKVAIWTYKEHDTIAVAKKMKEAGADYFTTNYPCQHLS